jgi:hypothetical protein
MELLSGIAEPVVVTIPDPPAPFVRLKGGGIAVYAEDADGNKVYNTIYEHDLFPIRRLSNLAQGLEQQVWHADLPRGESKDFTLDADMLYDTRKFVTAIANQGVYPHKGNIPGLQEYMVAYIAQLQKARRRRRSAQPPRLDRRLHPLHLPRQNPRRDGTAKPAQLSVGAQRASAHVRKGGDINKQVELLRFYAHPAYRAHQFVVLAGLAAPIFFATGHHGVIVNASGDAGASKSTALYTAASFWGQPELYPINGTNNGATVRGRNERVATLANLPVCVDEITHMPAKDAVDLAMSITQPGHRIRLDTTGIERANLESYKATIMLSTGNNSLHGLLSTDNAAGTAGSMRVFEMRFKPTGIHTKAQADDYLHELKQNYGHFGELFVQYVMKNLPAVQARVRELVREIDASCAFSRRSASGRARSPRCSSPARSPKRWASSPTTWLRCGSGSSAEQVPEMRGIVKEEYSDPLGIVTDYLETISSNILVMEKLAHASQQNLINVKRRPVGSLLAHYDTDDQVLYVLKKGFKDYCNRIGANARKIVDDLHAAREGGRIVVNTNSRRTLGAGTEFAKAQSWCFVINMAQGGQRSDRPQGHRWRGGGRGDGRETGTLCCPVTSMCPGCGFDLALDQPVIINDFSMLSAMSPLYYRGNPIKLTFSERTVVWAMMKAFPRPVSHEVMLNRLDSEAEGNVIDVYAAASGPSCARPERRSRSRAAAPGAMPAGARCAGSCSDERCWSPVAARSAIATGCGPGST